MDGQARWYVDELPLAGGVIADVGANVGRLSEVFWRAGGTVVSIEPLRSNVRAIESRIAALQASRWIVQACAAADHDGELELVPFVAKELDGAWNSERARASDTSARVRVPCRRLSTLVPDATVVKIDIEGQEYDVLDEALPRLEQVRAWALELHMLPNRPLEGVLDQLRGHGFASFAASRVAGDTADAPWRAIEIPPAMSWSSVPIARVRADGSAFKMLHVIARRR